MPNYHRAVRPGGTFFFTVVTYDRIPFLCDGEALPLLRSAIRLCQTLRPFEIEAFVLLPDHLHTIWTLPEGDSDFSTRWGLIKKAFTQSWLASGGGEGCVSVSREANQRRGVWQRRFWEHVIRDQDDLNRHLDYIHYNPVKHGLVKCPHEWEHSSFHRWVKGGHYESSWCCACHGCDARRPRFEGLDQTVME